MDHSATQNNLQVLVSRAGMQGGVVTDKDGVVVLEVSNDSSISPLSPAFAATFSLVTDQANKMKLGGLKSLTSFYDELVVVSLVCSPLCAFFYGNPSSANPSLAMDAHAQVNAALGPLAESIKE